MLSNLKCESLLGIGAARGDVVEVQYFDTGYRQKLLVSQEWGVRGHVAAHAVYPIDWVTPTGFDPSPLGLVFIWDGWLRPEPGVGSVDAHFIDLNLIRIPLYVPFREAKTVAKVASEMLWGALVTETALGANLPISSQFVVESVRCIHSLCDYIIADDL
jgi:hypothetical protein